MKTLLGSLALTLAALSVSSVMAAPPKIETPLIPRAVFFGNPDKANTKISPDGKQISFLAPVNGVLNIWVAPADKPEAAKAITNDASRGIRQYHWAYSSTHILYLQDKGGDENWKVYSVDLANNAAKDLTPFETIPGPDGKPAVGPDGKVLRPRAELQEVSHRFPDEILIALNNRDPQFHDIFRVNIRTGEMKLIQKNDEYGGFLTDDNYAVRFATKLTADGGSEYFIKEGDAFKSYEKVPMEDSMTTHPAGFDKSGQVLYLTDSRKRDTGALYARDLKTGAQTLIAEDPRADAGGVLAHPTENTIQAVAFNYDRTTWKVVDPSIQKDLDYLKTVADGEFTVTSRSLDDQKWTVSYLLDNGPAKAYLYDRTTGKANFLFSNRKNLEGLALVKMRPIVIKSRDGLNLVSYLTVPVGCDPGIGAAPLPLVLFVHGGPWARDQWGFNPYHQWLANRGYAVLSVNYRGSTGFGKKFGNAANKEWAGKMHDDLLDAVNWCVDNKIALRDKVCIMGGSYGGYATLVGLTFTPDVFACGVDIVGPSSILTLLKTIPPYWKPAIDMFRTRVGDESTEEGRKFLESRSPLTFVDKIKKPLLIGQGANDPRVKQSEADQIVSAMNTKKIPVTYVLFPDEGHGFARPENNKAFNAVTEIFLAAILGGRAEAIGDDFKGSSITVPNGAENIPGLSEALANTGPKK